MLTQSIPERYRVHRRRGHTAHVALGFARTRTQPIYYSEPAINPAFATDPESPYSTDDRFRWVENVTDLGWRNAGFSDEIRSSIRHRGWYADEYCDTTYRGIVYRLPRGRYLYGYADPHNSGCALLADATISDIDDAARFADRVAELFAQRQRQYDAAWHALNKAMSDASHHRDSAREALADVRALETCDSPRIKRTIQSNFETAWHLYKAAMTELARVFADAEPYGFSASDF